MTPDLTRLRGFVEAAKAPGDLPWAMIEEDAARWLAEHGDSLLAIAEAYAGAPESYELLRQMRAWWRNDRPVATVIDADGDAVCDWIDRVDALLLPYHGGSGKSYATLAEAQAAGESSVIGPSPIGQYAFNARIEIAGAPGAD